MAGKPRWRTVQLPRTISTQTDLRELALAGAPGGLVIRADEQVAGEGRRRRAWVSPMGGLWFSVLLRPRRADWGLVPLLAGSAVASVLQARGVPSTLKWPNDVLVADRKVAGVLAEGHTSPDPFVILGVGVNANVSHADLPAEVQKTATTIRAELGHDADLPALWEGLLDALAIRIERWEAGADEALLEEWRHDAPLLGTRVRLRSRSVLGRARDVATDGSLEVALEDGSRVHVTDDEDVEWLER